MAALPYIQLHIAEYLADTAHLTPTMTRNFGDARWKRGHFAGLHQDGRPSTFNDGATSFSIKDDGEDWARTYWNECRRPTEEEIKG